MVIDLAEIRPGDEIEYEVNSHTTGGVQAPPKIRMGKVIQVTGKHIAIKGKLYPDSILINDLILAKVKITKLKGEECEVAPTKREAPPRAELLEAFEKHSGKTDPLMKEFGAGWATIKRWLVEQNIITAEGVPILQTPTPEPDTFGSEEPDQGEEESATSSISQPEPKTQDESRKPDSRYAPGGVMDPTPDPSIWKKVCRHCGAVLGEKRFYHDGWLCPQCAGVELRTGTPSDEQAFNPTPPMVMPIGQEMPREDGFGPEDDEPIPYFPLVQPPEFNPDSFRLSLIEELICVAYRHNAPARATIGLVKDILNADLPEAW